jgi:hypothetical protein
LIRRQLGNSFGDFFDLHVTQYSIERVGWATENEWTCRVMRWTSAPTDTIA